MRKESNKDEKWYDSETWKKFGEILYQPNFAESSDENFVSMISNLNYSQSTQNIEVFFCIFVIKYLISLFLFFRSMTNLQMVEDFRTDWYILLIIM